MLEILPVQGEQGSWHEGSSTHERTLEKSLEGDMTKLSAEFDHDIKCCMLWSSNMLLTDQRRFSGHPTRAILLV